MGNRLTKIYTRTGDSGTTGLADGSRVDKTDLRIKSLGAMDELNASIGLIRTNSVGPQIDNMLSSIQHHLFDLGGEMSFPGQTFIKEDYVSTLENWLDELNDNLKPLKEFILPGGCVAAAQCHLSCTICRRVEIQLIELSKEQEINSHSLQYINRLSDFLFVCARALNKNAGHHDVMWKGLKPSETNS